MLFITFSFAAAFRYDAMPIADAACPFSPDAASARRALIRRAFD